MAEDIFKANISENLKNVKILKPKAIKMTIGVAGKTDDGKSKSLPAMLIQQIQHTTSRQMRKYSAIGTATQYFLGLPSQGQMSIRRIVSEKQITEMFGAFGANCWTDPFTIDISIDGTVIAKFDGCKIVSLGGSASAADAAINEDVVISYTHRLS